MLIILQLFLEVKVPPTLGTGVSYFMEVSYDSGCSTMAIPNADLGQMLVQGGMDLVDTGFSNTAGGRAVSRRVDLMVRVLNREQTGVVLGWRTVRCRGYEHSTNRIFRGNLENECFTRIQPYLDRLYVGHTRTHLARMPAGSGAQPLEDRDFEPEDEGDNETDEEPYEAPI